MTGKLTVNLLTGYVPNVAAEHSEPTIDNNQSHVSGEQTISRKPWLGNLKVSHDESHVHALFSI